MRRLRYTRGAGAVIALNVLLNGLVDQERRKVKIKLKPDSVKADEFLSNYERMLSEGNKRFYLHYAKDFLEFAQGKELTRETVGSYLNHLKETKNYKQGSLNFVFRVIRTLYRRNGLEWSFRRGEAPQIGQRDENKPALDPDSIKQMIMAKERLEADECAFLALSTTYGLRRSEMSQLKPEDVSIKDRLIYIKTLRSGRQRFHLIPQEIIPILSSHDFSRKYSEFKMSQLFWSVVDKSGLQPLEAFDLGFHSIRRSLLTLLVRSGLDVLLVRNFLRWKGGESSDMPSRYYATSWVGVSGTKPVAEEAVADEEVFKVHPFVKFFKK